MSQPTSASPLVAIADDDVQVRHLLRRWLDDRGYRAVAFPTGDELLAAFDVDQFDAACVDVQMPGTGGLDVLSELRRRTPDLPVVLFSGAEGVDTAVEAMRRGALDFLVKPLDHGRLFEHLAPALCREPSRAVPGMVGCAPAMLELYRQIERVADAKISVLIRGESGTGKELVARAIHMMGRRANAPFVPLNCGAIPETLQESELFGHERGAFTGATATRAGKFERAGEGTLFLDEVAELTPATQVRLLRVLQERRVERVGGDREVEFSARVISASHKSLDAEVADGAFREDLYYRLAVYPVDVPPLRERKEDIPALARHLMRKHADDVGHPMTEIDPRAMELLQRHDWPGNVRELENTIYGAMIRARREVLDVACLPLGMRDPARPPLVAVDPRCESGLTNRVAPTLDPSPTTPSVRSMEDLERQAIIDALEASRGNVTLAAKQLGIGRATIYRRMHRLGIRKAG